jgi:hypothetical protein
MAARKWSREYTGFESIVDFDSDMHIEDALEAIVPNNEWAGTIRVTFEYIPAPEESKGIANRRGIKEGMCNDGADV